MKTHQNLFSKIVNLENLYISWREFRPGKRGKFDVCGTERNLEDNLFSIRYDLIGKTYKHSAYTSFYISDPKVRHIHKACVKDRVIHHAVHRILYPIFDRSFIFHTYSCRICKGTHRAVNDLEIFTRRVARNYKGPCWVLKCDIKKFFGSVDHQILFDLIKKKIWDEDVLSLIWEIISSFAPQRERERERVKKIPSRKPDFP